MSAAAAGHTARKDLSSLGDVLSQCCYILVIYGLSLFAAEYAYFASLMESAAHLSGASTLFAFCFLECHRFSSLVLREDDFSIERKSFVFHTFGNVHKALSDLRCLIHSLCGFSYCFLCGKSGFVILRSCGSGIISGGCRRCLRCRFVTDCLRSCRLRLVLRGLLRLVLRCRLLILRSLLVLGCLLTGSIALCRSTVVALSLGSIAGTLIRSCLRLSKLNVFCNYVGGIDFLSIPVIVTARLNTACERYLRTLVQILLCELGLLSECHAADKIGLTLSVSARSSPVDGNGKSRDLHAALGTVTGVTDIGVPGKSAH